MTPEKFLRGEISLYCGDSRDVLKSIPDNSIDSICTDPPYALVSIVKRFGKAGAAPAKGNEAYVRASAGFMGKQWDTGEVAFSEEFWIEVLRVLKPGGHVAAFGASRGYHRMACAIEDAGFEVRDSVVNVIDPKSPVVKFMASLNDEQLGAFMRCLDDAEFGGTLAWMYGTGFPKSHDVSKGIDKAAGAERPVVGTTKSGGFARIMQTNAEAGFRPENYYETGNTFRSNEPITPAARQWEGWGTALKPAFEPIVLARKPLSEGTVAANVLKWGTGALNIDGCRVPTTESLNGGAYSGSERRRDEYSNTDTVDGAVPLSRLNRGVGEFVQPEGRWPANVVHDGSDEVVGAFPASNGQQGDVTGNEPSPRTNGVYGQFNGRPATQARGDTGSAARFFFSAKADADDRLGSGHPTVKPVDLMQWIVRLITPPGGTTLDPFAGTGTTGEAAWREGMKAVLVERDAEYQGCIRRRMRLALAGPDERRRESIKAKLERKGEEIDLGPLFGGGT